MGCRHHLLLISALTGLLSAPLVGCGDDVPPDPPPEDLTTADMSTVDMADDDGAPPDGALLVELSPEETLAMCQAIAPFEALRCPKREDATVTRPALSVAACVQEMSAEGLPEGCQWTVGDLRVIADDDLLCTDTGWESISKAAACS